MVTYFYALLNFNDYDIYVIRASNIIGTSKLVVSVCIFIIKCKLLYIPLKNLVTILHCI